jgi:hypothetical protein
MQVLLTRKNHGDAHVFTQPMSPKCRDIFANPPRLINSIDEKNFFLALILGSKAGRICIYIFLGFNNFLTFDNSVVCISLINLLTVSRADAYFDDFTSEKNLIFGWAARNCSILSFVTMVGQLLRECYPHAKSVQRQCDHPHAVRLL